MDRFRGPRHGGASASKASASTICQKCLKKGHYSYECKGTVQDRPYISRPSRTQQLLNPKLAPKLNTENPNELLKKEGVADGILAKQAEERGRKRSRDDDLGLPDARKRSRSVSSYSSSSVSTISTNASRSRSPRRSRSRTPRRNYRERDEYLTSQHQDTQSQIPPRDTAPNRKRQRRSSTSSYSSYDSYSSRDSNDRRRSRSRERDRNTRRRHSSFSPVERGRRRSRSYRSASRSVSRDRHTKRRRSRSLSSRSENSYDDERHGRPPPGKGKAPGPTRRRNTSSASEESRPPRQRQRSKSMESGRGRPIAGDRAAPPPRRGDGEMRSRSGSRSPYRAGNGSRAAPTRLDSRNERKPIFNRGQASGRPNGSTGAPPPRKERSLSPYSKRLALTHAMNRR